MREPKRATRELELVIRTLRALARDREAGFANLCVRADGRAEIELFDHDGTHCAIERFDFNERDELVPIWTPEMRRSRNA